MQRGNGRETGPSGPGQQFSHGFAAGMDVEFGVKIFHIHANGLKAHLQLLGDLLVGVAAREQFEHLPLPGGQPVAFRSPIPKWLKYCTTFRAMFALMGEPPART